MSASDLTESESRVLAHIVSFRKAHYGNSPSIRETMTALGYKSPFAVQKPLDALLEKGFLVRVGRFNVPTGETRFKK